MTVKNLNHVNIQTHDMEATAAFYSGLLGLEPRPTARRPASDRLWFYDRNGQAVIHLNRFGTDNTVPREVIPGAHTGAIHHVAFECEGLAGVLARIEAMGLSFARAEIPELGLTQLFVTDPNHVLLELNFRDRAGGPPAG